MRDFFKSLLSFSWAMSLFGVRQLGSVLRSGDSGGREDAAAAFESVARAAEGQLGDALKGAYRTGDRLQRTTLDAAAAGAGSTPARAATANGGGVAPTYAPAHGAQTQAPVVRAYSGRLDTSVFVTLGEGLAAGVGDFTLSADTQADSFPAQMARRMGVEFTQPLIDPPGVGNPVGFDKLPVVVPAPFQTTVLDGLPPPVVSNLSVPSYRLSDALDLRPAQPLVRRADAKQTACNLVLGVLSIAYGEQGPLATQLEYALNRRPTFALVELGYHEALEAAVRGDASLMPSADAFRSDYARLLGPLKGSGAEVLALTVPDPFDTAHFSNVATAAKILKVEPSIIVDDYGLRADDLITASGLNEIGFQLFARERRPLPEGAVVSAASAAQVCARVREFNDAINAAAREQGAIVYDLCALFRRVKDAGVNVGARRLTAEYLGGFYSLNGYYPGATGHAVIANELLDCLNRAYGADFSQVDLQAVSLQDPVADYRQAEGPNWTSTQHANAGVVVLGAGASSSSNVRGDSSPALGVGTPREHVPSGWEQLGQAQGHAPTSLTLPPGLEQTLPLSKSASYFGDGIGALRCRDDRGVHWGACGGYIFGGLAMVDSHLSGSLRIRFTEPRNGVTHFQVSFPGGLAGDDAVLVTPRLFRMAFQQARVDEVPGTVSEGTLNLSTGEVTDLKLYAAYGSTALRALVGINPTFPRQPLSFPGPYGSVWARFEQRADGLLDFTFYGSTFVPLGEGIRWPLNFFSPTGQFATIPAAGTVMHPHLSLSTKEPEFARDDLEPPDIPFNTIQELTLFTHNSAFGDAFTLNSAELGGRAKGRSHILGRALLQFGERSGDTVPVAVSLVNAGGVMAALEPSPITEVFPGRLYQGPQGFDEFLRFPLRTYSLDDLAILDDPFDVSVGSVDLKTGMFTGELLHRGFINQDLIFALLRVEPRTPKDSFFFRGPAVIERGATGRLIFRFNGIVRVPYPQGFLFPNPNLTTGFPVGPDSVLDPFLWVHAIQDEAEPRGVMRGGESRVLASAGEFFSYSYEIPHDASEGRASFEYENHTQQGVFRMHSLAWAGFGFSGHAIGEKSDTISFTGFGVWEKDGVRRVVQASAQFSTSSERPYVGIQIDGGAVSNVNTKPANEKDALP